MDSVFSVPVLIGVPFGVVAALSTISPTAAVVFHKICCYAWAWIHVFLSSEGSLSKRLKETPDPDQLLNHPTQKVTVIFVRHGESAWNEIFNKGAVAERLLLMGPRLVSAVISEVLCFFTPRSIFLDSPLSREGIAQAQKLRALVEGKDALQKKSDAPDAAAKYLEVLAGKEGKSVLTSSNLVRAAETMTIGFWSRVQAGEKVHIRSDLQEISRNIDTMALAPAKDVPPITLGAALEFPSLDKATRFEASGNRGQKSLFGNPVRRISSFAAWCFDESNPPGAAIIAGGHSLYFKTFFQAYLGRAVEHQAKQRKIVNCGVVAFTLHKGTIDGKELFRIDPDSITVITGGFK